MKKILLFIIFFFLLQAVLFAQGVDFRPLTFEKALEAARKENRLVFVDCSTKWCSACQHMFKKVFPTREAGDFFNANFVCIKLDMEVGEGPELGRRFNVCAYPTFLLIRPDGTEQYRVLGGGGIQDFIARIRKGMDERTCLPFLERCYDEGKRDRFFLVSYYAALLDAHRVKEAGRIHGELSVLLTPEDRLRPECWPYFSMVTYGSEDFRFIRENEVELRKSVGDGEVDSFLGGVYFKAVKDLMFRQPGTEEIQRLEKEISALKIARRETLLLDLGMAKATVEGDVEKFAEVVEANLEKISNGERKIFNSSIQKMREKGKTKAEYARLLETIRKLQAIQVDPDVIRSLKVWRHVYECLVATGVYFEEAGLEEAYNLAKILGYRVLVLCHDGADRAGEKRLAKVFGDEAVGKHINIAYTAAKVDMRKEAGKAAVSDFRVDACPVVLILNAEGSLVGKVEVTGDPAALLKRLHEQEESTGTIH